MLFLSSIPIYFAATIALVNGDPRILPLSEFRAGVFSVIENVEDGAKLYLASNDDTALLRNIRIQTGGVEYTLDQLDSNNETGNANSIRISGDLSISTNNTNTDLTGFLYLTTRQQADDPTFSVYVIKQAHTISTTLPNSTVVILNTQLNTGIPDASQPLKTSYVTNINQFPDSDLFFHWGIPSFNWTQYDETNQFFENPMRWEIYDWNLRVTNYSRQFFDHIEPLQIGLDYWYITASEPVSMTVENKYVTDLIYNTTSINTTGLVVSDFIFQEHVVNFQLDFTSVRTIGTLVSVEPDNSTISFLYVADDVTAAQGYNEKVIHTKLVTSMQAPSLTISATSLTPGKLHCQYFGVTGNLLLPGTSIPSTTVPTITSVW